MYLFMQLRFQLLWRLAAICCVLKILAALDSLLYFTNMFTIKAAATSTYTTWRKMALLLSFMIPTHLVWQPMTAVLRWWGSSWYWCWPQWRFINPRSDPCSSCLEAIIAAISMISISWRPALFIDQICIQNRSLRSWTVKLWMNSMSWSTLMAVKRECILDLSTSLKNPQLIAKERIHSPPSKSSPDRFASGRRLFGKEQNIKRQIRCSND